MPTTPAQVGWVMAANVVPGIIFMLLGGAMADRRSRRQLLVWSSCASCAIYSAMATLLVTGHFSVRDVALLSAAAGVVSGFNGPALRGILPELVPAARLQEANAALATARNLTRVVGPSLAGILVVTVGGGWALALDAVSCLVAAACFTRLPRTTSALAARNRFSTDLVDGFRSFASMGWMWRLSLTFVVVNLLNVGPWQVLGPTVIAQHHSMALWGTILSARAVGLLLTSTALLRIKLPNPLVTGLVLGTLTGLPLAVLGFGCGPMAVAFAAALGAIGFTASGIAYDTTLQTQVPAGKLSRISAIDNMVSFVSVPISQAAAAPLASLVGTRRLLTACGLGIVISYLAPLASRTVRQVPGPGLAPCSHVTS